MQAQRLGELIESGDAPATRQAVEDELRGLLAAQFDLRQRLGAHRLERSTEELDRMAAELDERAERRDEIIEGQLERIRSRAGKGPGFGRPGRGPGRGRGRDRD